jgi:hypothetical protein
VRIEIAVTYSKQTRETNSNRNSFRGPRRRGCGRNSHLCRAEGNLSRAKPRGHRPKQAPECFSTACAGSSAQLRPYGVDVRTSRPGSRATGRGPRVTNSRFGPRTGIPVRGLCVPVEFAGRGFSAIPGHYSRITSHNSPTGEEKSNRNCRSEKHRHQACPDCSGGKRPSGVEGTLFKPGWGTRTQHQGEEKANRNIRPFRFPLNSFKIRDITIF